MTWRSRTTGWEPLILLLIILSASLPWPSVVRADESGPLIEGITLFGNIVTQDHILLRELSVEAEDRLRPDVVTRVRRTLERLPFIEYADIMEKRVGDDRVHLMIQVEESSRLDLNLFSDYRHLPRHLNYIRGPGLTVRNFRGQAEELILTSVAPWSMGYGIRWSTSWFLGLPSVSFFADGYWQRFDYDVESQRLEERGAKVGLSYDLIRCLQVWISYNTRRFKIDRAADHAREGTILDPSVHIGLELDLRDRKAYPHQGVQASLEHRWSRPGSSRAYRTFKGHLAGFIPLPTGSIFCQRVTYLGGSRSLPFYQKAYLGGSYDLRGLDSGAFRGDNSLVATLELRHPLISIPMNVDSELNIGAHAFNDWGKAWDHGQGHDDQEFHSTWGLGLHLGIGNANFRFEWVWAETGYRRFILAHGWTF